MNLKNQQPDQPIVVVALWLQCTDRNNFLIVRRGPGQSGAGEWEFPGGKVEPGESQTLALVREIHEELHLDLQENKLIFIADHIHHYPTKKIHLHLWKYEVDSSQIQKIILSEHDQIAWVTLGQLEYYSLSAGDLYFKAYLK